VNDRDDVFIAYMCVCARAANVKCYSCKTVKAKDFKFDSQL